MTSSPPSPEFPSNHSRSDQMSGLRHVLTDPALPGSAARPLVQMPLTGHRAIWPVRQLWSPPVSGCVLHQTSRHCGA
jgi:hypothetical protein